MSIEPGQSSCCAPNRDDPEPRNVEIAETRDQSPNAVPTKTSTSMVRLSGGEFRMGTDHLRFPEDGEHPIRDVTVDGFEIATHPVTNREFDEFVCATAHVTDAEKYGWSFVFKDFVTEEAAPKVTQVVQEAQWWWKVAGATWRCPDGPGSDIEDRADHPVTHVSWNDAIAYCEWSSTRLPTEAEWEFAARGGLDQAAYAWGDELSPDGDHMCNIWQGEFPNANTLADGHHGTSPVGTYAPNGFGLYDVAGNVWEWCSDWFSATFHRNARRVTRENPRGPRTGAAKVVRGGSYLCHDSYCNRYRVGARTSNTPDSSTGHMGFRVVS